MMKNKVSKIKEKIISFALSVTFVCGLVFVTLPVSANPNSKRPIAQNEVGLPKDTTNKDDLEFSTSEWDLLEDGEKRLEEDIEALLKESSEWDFLLDEENVYGLTNRSREALLIENNVSDLFTNSKKNRLYSFKTYQNIFDAEKVVSELANESVKARLQADLTLAKTLLAKRMDDFVENVKEKNRNDWNQNDYIDEVVYNANINIINKLKGNLGPLEKFLKKD